MVPKDQPLFGPIDQAINTVDFEITCVAADIERCKKTILRKEEEIETLEERLQNLKALWIRKMRTDRLKGKKKHG